MTRRMIFLLALVAILTMTVSASWATAIQNVEVLGPYFFPKPSSVQLCAQIFPGYTGAQVKFEGETLYHDITFKAKYGYTNPLGIACVKTTWPQGIYEVEAKVSAQNSVTTNYYESDPAAVSVFNPNGFCGAQGGGALFQLSYLDGCTTKQTLRSRKSTYAFIFKKSQPNNFGIFYFDNDNPKGPVEFEARQWFDSNILYFQNPDYASIELIGMGEAEVGSYEGPVRYYMYADTYPGTNQFYLLLWDITGKLIYQSQGPEQAFERIVYQGQNVIVPCDGDEGWPCEGDCP